MHNGKLQEVLHSKVSQNDLGTFKDKQVTIHIVIYSTPSSKKGTAGLPIQTFRFIQSVTNDLLHGQFAMQMYALHQVDVTS